MWRNPILQGLGLGALAASAFLHRPNEPDNFIWDYPGREAILARWEEINLELDGLDDHPWAGIYSLGDNYFSASLALAPNSGFAATSLGCLGPMSASYGSVHQVGDRVRLMYEFSFKEYEDSHGWLEYAVIPWGERRYLVESRFLLRFCNAVNSGVQGNQFFSGVFYLRNRDYHAEVTGLPEVPGEFSSYLLRQPIEATITGIDEIERTPQATGHETLEVPVRLDVGWIHGLRDGMWLYLVHDPDPLVFVEINETEIGESHATFRSHAPDEIEPRIGWKVCTSGVRDIAVP